MVSEIYMQNSIIIAINDKLNCKFTGTKKILISIKFYVWFKNGFTDLFYRRCVIFFWKIE